QYTSKVIRTLDLHVGDGPLQHQPTQDGSCLVDLLLCDLVAADLHPWPVCTSTLRDVEQGGLRRALQVVRWIRRRKACQLDGPVDLCNELLRCLPHAHLLESHATNVVARTGPANGRTRPDSRRPSTVHPGPDADPEVSTTLHPPPSPRHPQHTTNGLNVESPFPPSDTIQLIRRPQTMAGKHVFYFGNGFAEGGRDDKQTLGGKGANLAEMTRIGVPVPPGFTISTDACRFYLREE